MVSTSLPAAAGSFSGEPAPVRRASRWLGWTHRPSHRGPRLTRRQRRAAREVAAAADIEATVEWFQQMRAMTDIALEPADSGAPSTGLRLTDDVDDSALDHAWSKWSELHGVPS